MGRNELVHIHLFIDENGRQSRLLSTLCLYRAVYPFKRLLTVMRQGEAHDGYRRRG
ncbi:MAG TPA: hypothetical protein VK540_27355 [Polyangiaceae bacterium]|nr:hypothetical protein [Polyangiaceae bacterium]